MSLKIRYQIADLTGDDHRAGVLDCWQNDGVFSAESFTPPLIEGHDYTIRVAVELYGGGLSPWSSAQRISAIEQAITEFWLQNNGATAYLGWSLADPSVAPPIDVQLRVNGGDWINVPTQIGGQFVHLDPRRFHALTDNAWLGQTVTLTARARLNASRDWLESDPITSQGGTGIARPVFYWNTGGPGMALQYTRPSGTETSVWLSIDGGPSLSFDPAYPAGKTFHYYPDWRIRIPAPFRDGQEHTLQFRVRETADGVTRDYWSLAGIGRIDSLATLAPPLVHAVEWMTTQGHLFARVTFKPIPSTHALTVSLQLDSAQPSTQTLTSGQTVVSFPVTDDERGWRLLRITSKVRDVSGAESPAIVHTALLYRAYPSPTPIPAFNVQLLRQGDDVTPDRVRFTWTPVPGQLAELFAAYTPGNDYRKTQIYPLGYVDGTEHECTLDNTREHFPKTGQLLRISYGIRPYHLIAGFGIPITADPIQIRAEHPAVTPPPPDANTAQHWADEDLVEALESALAAAFPAVPQAMRMLLAAQTLGEFKARIKGIVAQGGRVTLADCGQFAAQWKTTRVGKILHFTERGVSFKPAPGFSAGVKAGTVMTDAEAEAAP
ncbi:MAG: hypothetical protein RKO66_00835 [Candidatus Contendobacter sp.]|nr:hypothetical protein [Candidatus Contendobacter sp.]MDS4060299.1 hypothetical protein [Candidatus Contendobacter sp.]